MCVWTSVAGSWCKSTSKLVYIKLAYGRGNRQLKLAWTLALRSRADERGNRQLKLARALALRCRANRRENRQLKLVWVLALRSSTNGGYFPFVRILHPAQTIMDVDYADDSASGKYTRPSRNPAT